MLNFFFFSFFIFVFYLFWFCFVQATPEEQEKLRIRRERNKEAAARCRKRRLDHTNNLLAQTGKLEEEKKNLQKEIDFLENQKNELEFYLKVHKSKCQYSLPDLNECKQWAKIYLSFEV